MPGWCKFAFKREILEGLEGGGSEEQNSGILPREKWKKRRKETTETCSWITDFNYKPQTDAAETTSLTFFGVTSGAKA